MFSKKGNFLISLISRRSASTAQLKSFQLKSIIELNDSLQLNYITEEVKEKKHLLLPLVWLRDHCKDEKCYEWKTNQRKSKCINLFEESQLSNKENSIKIENNDTLSVLWEDGLLSKYPIDRLIDESLPNTIQENHYKAWTSDDMKQFPRLKASNLSFSEFAKLFVKYGVVVIDEVDKNAEATRKLCNELGQIHNTFFGDFWVFSNQGESGHEDTAYGNEGIGPHTDGTYLDQTPGIQVFHCLHPAEVGGDTVLTDGYKCVEILKEKYPEAYKILTESEIDHHYLEGQNVESSLYSLTRSRKVIHVENDGLVRQIRFNPYDRAPLRFDSEKAADIISFYKAYTIFSKICHDEELAYRVSLRPGSVIFIDNYRVFHSRTAFTGFRQMAGCYMSRDNLLAKIRPYLNKKVQYLV